MLPGSMVEVLAPYPGWEVGPSHYSLMSWKSRLLLLWVEMGPQCSVVFGYSGVVIVKSCLSC